MSQFNHPSILRFIGFNPQNLEDQSNPVIITEYALNESLFHVINLERQGLAPELWSNTKKLINIYGIASAMSFLHSNNVLHRDLKPQNILENEHFYPKIADFCLSKLYHLHQYSATYQSTVQIKGTPMYIAPEIWETNNYDKPGDV